MKRNQRNELKTILATPTPPMEGLSEEKSQKVLGFGYMTADSRRYNTIKDYRNSLKKNPTEAEKVIWEFLRNKKTGFRIRRQHIIDIYIPDFVCLSKKVVLEIDGKIHLKNKERDEIRSCRLIELGYDIIRFTNEEVFNNPELVFFKIKNFLENIEEIRINKFPMGASHPPLEGLGEVAPIGKNTIIDGII